MGKKKGSNKNKLARMSEDERARYLQHRADMEEEARRRKQQLIALYLKNKLKREEAFSRLNLAKINQEWRFILRQVKCQELKTELVEVERLFQESLDQKNNTIRRLLRNLDEAEDLYSTLQQSHMENIDKLIGIQTERLEFFKKKYLNETEIILQDSRKDFQKYKNNRNKSQIQLESVFYELENQNTTKIRNAEEEHFKRVDNLRSEMTIKLENITKSRQEQLEQLWTEYQRILNDYVKYTESFSAEYSDLRARDDENTKLIRTHCYDIAKATDLIVELKLNANDLNEQHQFQMKYLEKYQKDLNDQFQSLKKNLEINLKFDKEQLKHMIITSHSINQILNKISKKGEYLLQLALICRKMESEKEKILPFGHTSKRKLCEWTTEELKGPPNEFKESTFGIWFNMENFWIRVNNCRLDTVRLQEEKIFLQEENTKLKAQLKDYLINVTLAAGGGTVQDKIINRPSSMKIEQIIHIDLNNENRYSKKNLKRRPITCVEDSQNHCKKLKTNDKIKKAFEIFELIVTNIEILFCFFNGKQKQTLQESHEVITRAIQIFAKLGFTEIRCGQETMFSVFDKILKIIKENNLNKKLDKSKLIFIEEFFLLSLENFKTFIGRNYTTKCNDLNYFKNIPQRNNEILQNIERLKGIHKKFLTSWNRKYLSKAKSTKNSSTEFHSEHNIIPRFPYKKTIDLKDFNGIIQFKEDTTQIQSDNVNAMNKSYKKTLRNNMEYFKSLKARRYRREVNLMAWIEKYDNEYEKSMTEINYIKSTLKKLQDKLNKIDEKVDIQYELINKFNLL